MLTQRHRDTERAWRRIAAFVILLALVLARPAAAQDERLVPGARVRVTETVGPWRRTRGEFVALRADTLLLSRADGSEVAVPLESMKVQVLARPSRRGAYGLVGFGLGAAAGFIIHRSLLDAQYSNDEWNGIIATVIGAPIGALAGGVAGIVLGAPRWATVRVGVQINTP